MFKLALINKKIINIYINKLFFYIFYIDFKNKSLNIKKWIIDKKYNL